MCASFAATASYRDYVEALGAVRLPLVWPRPEAAPNLEPRDPVRPTDPAPVIRLRDDGVELVQMRFGFKPARPKAGPIINFRSEGRRFGRGRCLVPVSWFYEYTGEKYPKTRWKIFRPGEPFFCLAAICRAGEGDWPESFSLLTIEPGPDVAPYHNRAVVALAPADWPGWLDGSTSEAELLRPQPAGTLTVEPAPARA
jgi:putative SOS response-associated peptidase YedK